MQGRIYDISIGLTESMPVWPGNPGFERSLSQSMEEGASATVSKMVIGSHVGTHVDAPAHFIQGATPVDKLPLDVLIGKGTVFELDVKDNISVADLEPLEFDGITRALFKTRNSSLWEQNQFTPEFVSFDHQAAAFLVENGIELVGIDYLSVGEYENGVKVHHTFLEHGVVIVEGLNLSEVPPGSYEIICLPLKVTGADGAPARVVLREWRQHNGAKHTSAD